MRYLLKRMEGYERHLESESYVTEQIYQVDVVDILDWVTVIIKFEFQFPFSWE